MNSKQRFKAPKQYLDTREEKEDRKPDVISPVKWLCDPPSKKNTNDNHRSSNAGAHSLQYDSDESTADDGLQIVLPGGGIDPSDQTSMSSLARRHPSEPRIVAPNVSKLSPQSAVEIRLESVEGCVAVLCSVDVLKMRSSYFHDLLSEQEVALSSNLVENRASNILWRETITLQEDSPYEAAAFLESIHEGRALFRGDWNFVWARLSVQWIIEDLITEYSAHVEIHTNKLLNFVKQNHWRTNPNVLAGMRVAVFRKGSSPLPTIVTGTAVESLTHLPYSKVRIVFDKIDQTTRRVPNVHVYESTTNRNSHEIKAMSTLSSSNYASTSISNISNTKMLHSFSPQRQHRPSNANAAAAMDTATSKQKFGKNLKASAQTPLAISSNGLSQQLHILDSDSTSSQPISSQPDGVRSTPSTRSEPIMGDISEPFWVQPPSPGALWSDPDELFLDFARDKITVADKIMFWEMARAIMELPGLSNNINSGIRCTDDLTEVLKRPEHRLFWIPKAPEFLPKSVASELIATAYVLPNSPNKHPDDVNWS